MLGNWSFGDYFKEEAIGMAWELLTKEYGLEVDRLYVTYFEGDKASGVEPDLEAKAFWMKIGVTEDHILLGNMKDNFWEMGDQGPCGPCSEVHYDRIGGRNAAHLVNMDDPNVLEIWNIVFIQFNRQEDRSLKPLPNKHIDTGMGFERVVSILQNKTSNYDTDVFYPLFRRIQEITGARQYTDKYGKDDVDGIDMAYRVVADHIRTLAIAISDGAVPNNEGRGYVVRRVLRRGCRYASKYLNAEIGSFFAKVLPTLIEQLGDHFPVLREKHQTVELLLNQEEAAFGAALIKGGDQFEKDALKALSSGTNKLSGEQVWRLYDTYGFPEDLTKLMCEERGLSWDENEIAIAREKARMASKQVGTSSSTTKTFSKPDVHQLGKLKDMGLTETDSSLKYSQTKCSAKILLLFEGENFVETSDAIKDKSSFGVILDRTNFYAEQGGQVADKGKLSTKGAEFEVEDCQVYSNFVVHNGQLSEGGSLKKGDEVTCEYDITRRDLILKNHTGTHVLNHALRKHLDIEYKEKGPEPNPKKPVAEKVKQKAMKQPVDQRGSLVDSEKLRFDFSHIGSIEVDMLKEIEESSIGYINEDSKVYAKDVDLATAKTIEGVRAVFGENYPDPVRVVSIGKDVDTLLADPSNKEWLKYSVEFCGGTHVPSTGAIKDLVIVEESGIANGVRRIVAYTGDAAKGVRVEADTFSKELDTLEALPFAEKVQKCKTVQDSLRRLVISTVTKATLLKRFDAIQKSVLDEQKKLQKAESKTALETIKTHFAAKEGSKVFIGAAPISANSKAVSDALQQYKGTDKIICLLGGGATGDSVVHGVHVDGVSLYAFLIPIIPANPSSYQFSF